MLRIKVPGIYIYYSVAFILFSSIYLARYVQLSKTRQLQCHLRSLHGITWVMRDPSMSGSLLEVETGDFQLLFSRDMAPKLGQYIEWFGTVDATMQCGVNGKIRLNIQRYVVVDEMMFSPFYLHRFPLQSSIIGANVYLKKTEKELYSFLPSEHVVLLEGMVIGKKPSSRDSMSTAMKAAGLTHVLVASGANIAILVGFLQAVMRQYSSRKHRIIASLILATSYAVLIGNQPPILRALCMFYFVSVASLTGRKILWIQPLILSAFLLLVIQPFLVYSLSFWLTVLATLAIMIDGRLKDRDTSAPAHRLTGEFQESLSSTCTVFILTFPILLFSIGKVPLVTLISSVSLLWIVGPITIAGLLLIIGRVFLPIFIYQFLYLYVWLLLEVFIRFVNLFSRFSYFDLSVSSFGAVTVIGCYVIIGLWIFTRLALEKKKR